MTVDEGVDITKAQDRGVLKRIIKEGEGADKPAGGCLVSVHYTGTLLDGTKFDSSRDRNEPFEFTLGKGSVIKAWDIGVASMKRGEVCVLTCAPQYAYGAAGSPPKIPPNATLQFEIEMLGWQAEDLSPGKNKGILRHVLEPGEGSDSPNDGALVTVELEGRLAGESRVFDERTVTFPLGEGAEANVCEGLERALERFLKGERSRITLQPKYGFRGEGCAALGVPPDATLEYTVRLVSFEKAKEQWAMEAGELLEQAALAKEKGTGYFKKGKMQLAIKMYKRVVSLVEDLVESPSESEEVKRQAREYLVSAHLNLSLVYLKAAPAHPFEAREHAARALALQPHSAKGLFRRGLALLALGEAAAALTDSQHLAAAEPDNKAAQSQIAACRRALAQQRAKEKALYANMFDKFARRDAEVEKARAAEQEDVMGAGVGEWGAGPAAGGAGGEWTDEQRTRAPTDFERENPNILMLDKDGQFQNM